VLSVLRTGLWRQCPRLVARAIDEAVVLALQAGFLLVAAVLGGLSHLSGDDRAEAVALVAGVQPLVWLALGLGGEESPLAASWITIASGDR
jgi:hypothetical protein